jgi:hypothetical protein
MITRLVEWGDPTGVTAGAAIEVEGLRKRFGDVVALDGLDLETAMRLVLLEAHSAAADEITRELAPGAVEGRLRGSDPDFDVTLPAYEAGDVATSGSAAFPTVLPAGDDEGGTSRLNLRLPEGLKAKIEEAARREGLSLNAWLVRAAAVAVEGTQQRCHDAAQEAARDTPDGFVDYHGPFSQRVRSAHADFRDQPAHCPIDRDEPGRGARNRGDRTDTVVAVNPSDRDRPEDAEAAGKTVVDLASGTLSIRAPKPRGIAAHLGRRRGGSVDRTEALRVRSGAGHVAVEEASGRAEIVAAGDMTIGVVAGDADVKNLNGKTWIGGWRHREGQVGER